MKKLKSILLVDDDKASNYITQLLLEDLGAAEQIHVTLNGQEALNFLHAHCATSNGHISCPELILLDINMPVMDGFEFLEKFQRLPQSKNIQIVLLTTSMYHKDIEKAKLYHISQYVHKPITEEKLEGILSEIWKNINSER